MALMTSYDRSICLELFYVGPKNGGRTTNIRFLHSRMSRRPGPNFVGSLSEFPEFGFELIDPEIRIGNWQLKTSFIRLDEDQFQITASARRQHVQSNAFPLPFIEALVFVADSQQVSLDENVRVMNDLRRSKFGQELFSRPTPMLLQCNKRDCPDVLSPDLIESAMGLKAVTVIESVASIGTGVQVTYDEIIRIIVDQVG